MLRRCTRDFNGTTPLEIAVRYGHSEIVDLLLATEACIDFYPEIFADCCCGSAESISRFSEKLTFQNGCDSEDAKAEKVPLLEFEIGRKKLCNGELL